MLSMESDRKGMTPDLGNISAMWRNYAEALLKLALDPRTLRCGSGSLCDARGGACLACVMGVLAVFAPFGEEQTSSYDPLRTFEAAR